MEVGIMALQAAKDFIDHANRDEAIRKEARTNLKDVGSVGRRHGYDFTQQEMAHAMRERKGLALAGAGALCPELCICFCCDGGVPAV
jgi:hypothetical protein